MNWLQNKRTRAIPAIILTAALLLTGACTREPSLADIERHRQEIEEARTAKDKQFRYHSASPVDFKRFMDFSGLNYFPVDYNFRIPARLDLTVDPEHFQIQTSTAEARVYVRTGRLRFKLNNQEHTLMAYREADPGQRTDPNRLFIPFTDETTGKESYGGGRYLDIGIPADGRIIIDFNLAYNPYCNYNYKYSCPIPPAENRLPVRITAGEKVLTTKTSDIDH